MEESYYKRCNKCGETKPATLEFYTKQNGGKFGLCGKCKVCEKAYRQGEGREKRNISKCKWRKDNKEKIKSYKKEDKEKIKARRLRKKKEYAITKKLYYDKNKDRVKIWTRNWHINNPAKKKAQDLKRRARKINTISRITSEDINNIWESAKIGDTYKCNWCSALSNKDNCHLDHVIPLSKGGEDSKDNIVVSCAKCNLSKGSKTPEEFLKHIEDNKRKDNVAGSSTVEPAE